MPHTATKLLIAALLATSACSFIDDFGRFRGRKSGDSGPMSEDDEDASVAPADSSVEDASEHDAAFVSDADLADAADTQESGLPDAARPCADTNDGVACGPSNNLICLKGVCRTSRCGDGFTNPRADEQCDDANLVRHDGCEPSCRFSCQEDRECDNGQPCDGEERCSEAHYCVGDDVPATGTDCTRADQVAGKCDPFGYCVPDGCGDGVVGASEQCDPAENPPRIGCRADCTLGCTDDAQCADDDVCNGQETCDKARGECRSGASLPCVDDDPCSQDGQCDPKRGCLFTLIDADGDGVSEATCAPGSSFRGDDCAPDDDTAYPGATEYCDGKNNDCDSEVDEGAVMATCYHDRDGDGYPSQLNPITACSCPRGTRLRRPDGEWDCWDDPAAGGADVYPHQPGWFATGYPVPCPSANATCQSFDYDCQNGATPRYTDGNASCGLLGLQLLCAGDGYTEAPPACGVEGTYVVCSGTLACSERTERRRQTCH